MKLDTNNSNAVHTPARPVVDQSDKCFLLGVGAAKSGTTWLNRLIMNDPSGFTPIFEYHVWDALYGKQAATRRVLRPTFEQRIQSWKQTRQRGFGRKEVLRWKFQNNIEKYFDHFAAALSKPGCRVAADITPAYAGLPVEALSRIKQGFAARGIHVKVVFIMRDPVERCWSGVRMFQEKSEQMSVSQEQLLRERYAMPNTEFRTRYDLTINNLETVFDRENIHFAIFETLFSKSELDRLSSFVGVAPDYSRISVKENARPKETSIDVSLRREIATHYAQVYRFCLNRFPEVSTAWPNIDLALSS